MNIEITSTEKCVIIQALYDMRADLNRKLKEHDPSDPQGCSSLAIACAIKELNVVNSALQKISGAEHSHRQPELLEEVENNAEIH